MNILKMFKSKIIKILGKYFFLDAGNRLPIFYIKGNQTLPPPLDIEEEEKLLKKLMQNDENAKQILAQRNLRLVVYIAKKFENTGIDFSWNNRFNESN